MTLCTLMYQCALRVWKFGGRFEWYKAVIASPFSSINRNVLLTETCSCSWLYSILFQDCFPVCMSYLGQLVITEIRLYIIVCTFFPFCTLIRDSGVFRTLEYQCFFLQFFQWKHDFAQATRHLKITDLWGCSQLCAA